MSDDIGEYRTALPSGPMLLGGLRFLCRSPGPQVAVRLRLPLCPPVGLSGVAETGDVITGIGDIMLTDFTRFVSVGEKNCRRPRLRGLSITSASVLAVLFNRRIPLRRSSCSSASRQYVELI